MDQLDCDQHEKTPKKRKKDQHRASSNDGSLCTTTTTTTTTTRSSEKEVGSGPTKPHAVSNGLKNRPKPLAERSKPLVERPKTKAGDSGPSTNPSPHPTPPKKPEPTSAFFNCLSGFRNSLYAKSAQGEPPPPPKTAKKRAAQKDDQPSQPPPPSRKRKTLSESPTPLKKRKPEPTEKLKPPTLTAPPVPKQKQTRSKEVVPLAKSHAGSGSAPKIPSSSTPSSSKDPVATSSGLPGYPLTRLSSSGGVTPRTTTTNDSPNSLWIDRFRPRSLDQVVGNRGSITRLKSWVQERKERRNNARVMVVHGPSGVGKTLSIHLALGEAGYELYHASAALDENTPRKLRRVMGEYIEPCSMPASGRKYAVIVSELDAICDADECTDSQDGTATRRITTSMDDIMLPSMSQNNNDVTRHHRALTLSGLVDYFGTLPSASAPVVLICNDLYGSKKLLPVRKKCRVIEMLEFRSLKSSELKAVAHRVMNLAKSEPSLTGQIIDQIVSQQYQGDARQLIQTLQLETIYLKTLDMTQPAPEIAEEQQQQKPKELLTPKDYLELRRRKDRREEEQQQKLMEDIRRREIERSSCFKPFDRVPAFFTKGNLSTKERSQMYHRDIRTNEGLIFTNYQKYMDIPSRSQEPRKSNDVTAGIHDETLERLKRVAEYAELFSTADTLEDWRENQESVLTCEPTMSGWLKANAGAILFDDDPRRRGTPHLAKPHVSSQKIDFPTTLFQLPKEQRQNRALLKPVVPPDQSICTAEEKLERLNFAKLIADAKNQTGSGITNTNTTGTPQEPSVFERGSPAYHFQGHPNPCFSINSIASRSPSLSLQRGSKKKSPERRYSFDPQNDFGCYDNMQDT